MMDKTQWQAFWKILKGRLVFAVFLLFVCVIFTRWVLPVIHQPSSAMTLESVESRQLLRLHKNFDAGNVYSLNLRIRGHLNGTAILRIFDADDEKKIYQEKIIGSGDVDTRMGGDWNANDCHLEYEPHTATTGPLKIEYVFKASQLKK